MATWQFEDSGLLAALDSAPADRIDDLGFGLIVMDRDGGVTGYNQANNYLIAERFHDARDAGAGDLDEQLDYVFTYRMSPTPVRLRLMAQAGSAHQYLAVRLR